MTDTALLQMFATPSALPQNGKSLPNTAIAGSQVAMAEGLDAEFGAVFSDLLLVESDVKTQQTVDPEISADLTLPVANVVSALNEQVDVLAQIEETGQPFNPLIQTQNPNLEDLPPAIAVIGKSGNRHITDTSLEYVPFVTDDLSVGHGTANNAAGEKGLNRTDKIGGGSGDLSETDIPSGIPSDVDLIGTATGETAELPMESGLGAIDAPTIPDGVENTLNPQAVVDTADGLTPDYAVETNPIAVSEGQAAVDLPANSVETQSVPVTEEAVIAATTPGGTSTVPAQSENGVLVQKPAAHGHDGRAAAPSGTPNPAPDDQADQGRLPLAEAPVKPVQPDDRRLTADQTADRSTVDTSKSGSQADQGAQFSDGRGDERKGQQPPSHFINAIRDGGPALQQSGSVERGQNSSFANALLGAGQSAELDTTYEQMPARLRIAAANGVKQLTVHLQPASLGAMEVRLEGAEDGAIRATFLVQRPETLDMLQRDARILERALGDAGITVDRDSLNFSMSNQNGRDGASANEDNPNGNGLGGNADEATDDSNSIIEQEIPIDTAAIIEAGRIDVHI